MACGCSGDSTCFLPHFVLGGWGVNSGAAPAFTRHMYFCCSLPCPALFCFAVLSVAPPRFIPHRVSLATVSFCVLLFYASSLSCASSGQILCLFASLFSFFYAYLFAPCVHSLGGNKPSVNTSQHLPTPPPHLRTSSNTSEASDRISDTPPTHLRTTLMHRRNTSDHLQHTSKPLRTPPRHLRTRPNTYDTSLPRAMLCPIPSPLHRRRCPVRRPLFLVPVLCCTSCFDVCGTFCISVARNKTRQRGASSTGPLPLCARARALQPPVSKPDCRGSSTLTRRANATKAGLQSHGHRGPLHVTHT